jgi:hemerythrin
MALIKWTEELTLGIASMDEQHRHLVEIIKEFADAAQKGKGSRMMNKILDELVGYTQEHFADEERLLTEAGFPQLAQHQAQHRQLIQKVERFQFDFNQSGNCVTGKVEEFLTSWLTSHILGDDKAYAEYLQTEKVDS